jgi:hypothetical protein
MKIDSSSVTWTYPNLDSNILRNEANPTFLLTPKILKDSIPDSLIRIFFIPGQYNYANDTTLEFIPYIPFIPNMEYSLSLNELKGVFWYNPGNRFDTTSFNNQVVTFKTAKPIPKIIARSSNKQSMNCNDTIWVQFNQEMNSIATPLGDIIELFSLDSIQLEGDSIVGYHTTQIVLIHLPDPNNSSKITSIPITNLEPGQEYIVKYHGDYLTGNYFDFVQDIITVKSGYNLVLKAEEISGESTTLSLETQQDLLYNSVGYNYVEYGDTVSVFAKYSADNLRFVEWEISDSSALVPNDLNQLKFSKTCPLKGDVYVTAKYTQLGDRELIVMPNDSLLVKIFNDTLGYVGSSGTFTITPIDTFYIVVTSLKYTNFTRWKSNNKKYNNKTTPVLKVVWTGTNIFIDTEKIIIDPPTTADYCVCPEAWLDGSYCDDTIEEVVDITPNNCVHTGTNPDIVNITCCINQDYLDKWNIIGYLDIVGDEQNVILFEQGEESATVNVLSTDPCRKIIFFLEYIDRTTTLIVESIINKSKLTPNGGDGIAGMDVDVHVDIYECYNGVLQNDLVHYERVVDGIGTYYIDKITPGSLIVCTAIYNLKEEGFSFSRWWDDNDGDYTFPIPTNQEQFSFVMTSDKNVKAEFYENFRLRQIGFYRDDDRANVRWYTTKQLRGQFVDDVEVYDFKNSIDNGYGTRIHFLFNDEVNPLSIKPIHVYDKSERVDDVIRFGTTKFGKGHYQTSIYQNCDFVPNKEIYFDVFSTINNRSIPKGEEFLLSVGSLGTIQLDNNISQLINPIELNCETELPGAIYQLTDIRFKGSSDWDSYIDWYIESDILLRRVMGEETQDIYFENQIPDIDANSALQPSSIFTDITNYEQSIILKQYDLNRNDEILISLIVWDWDCSDASDYVGHIDPIAIFNPKNDFIANF